MQTRKRIALVLFTVFMAVLPATALAEDAQETTVVPDRPGFADGTGVVPGGGFEIEAGLRADFDDDTIGAVLPQLLARYGLVGGWLELRANLPDVVMLSTPDDETRQGISDMAAGFKVGLGFADPVALSVVAVALLPTGSENFSSEVFGGLLELNFSVSTGGPFSVGGNIVGTVTEAPSVDTGGAGTAVESEDLAWWMGASLAPAYAFSDAASAFVEGIVTKGNDADWTPYVGAGIAFLLTPAVQLDVSVTVGLTEAATDVSAGAGAAIAF